MLKVRKKKNKKIRNMTKEELEAAILRKAGGVGSKHLDALKAALSRKIMQDLVRE